MRSSEPVSERGRLREVLDSAEGAGEGAWNDSGCGDSEADATKWSIMITDEGS